MKLSEQIKKLEEQGIDTSKFNLECNGTLLKPLELDKEKIETLNLNIEFRNLNSKNDLLYNVYLETVDSFKKHSRNRNGELEHGYDAYVRNHYRYEYQIENVIYNLVDFRDGNMTPEVARMFIKIYTKERITDLLTKILNHSYYRGYKSYRELADLIMNYKNSERLVERIEILKEFNRKCEWRQQAKHEVWKDMYRSFSCYCTILYTIDYLGLPFSKDCLNDLMKSYIEENKIYKIKYLLESLMKSHPEYF